ncbi:unnamed protein product [Durusdinium trenchii]|uniref:Uncharacterized protein n=1 Tax=Durusdinium trenchii TaxID=1381693 RepID=A0ABP0I4P3_9DINO
MGFKFLFGTLKFRFASVKLADGTALGWRASAGVEVVIDVAAMEELADGLDDLMEAMAFLQDLHRSTAEDAWPGRRLLTDCVFALDVCGLLVAPQNRVEVVVGGDEVGEGGWPEPMRQRNEVKCSVIDTVGFILYMADGKRHRDDVKRCVPQEAEVKFEAVGGVIVRVAKELEDRTAADAGCGIGADLLLLGLLGNGADAFPIDELKTNHIHSLAPQHLEPWSRWDCPSTEPLVEVELEPPPLELPLHSKQECAGVFAGAFGCVFAAVRGLGFVPRSSEDLDRLTASNFGFAAGLGFGWAGSSKRLGERLEGWPAMREERPQMDRVHHPEVKEKVIQVDEKVRDWMPSSGRELDGQALLAFGLERSRFLRGWYGLGFTGRLLFHDSAIWFNLTAQALGVRALKIVYKIHEGEHPQPICHPAAGGALCFTSFLMVDAWRSYVGKLASWPRRASSSARACFAFLFDEDAREECLLFCQSLSQQGDEGSEAASDMVLRRVP